MATRLPNYQKAVIPLEKIRDYALNPDHPVGKHKARVFEAELGIQRVHAETFVSILRVSLPRSPAVKGLQDVYGQFWTVYHEIIGLNGQSAVVTTVWMFKRDQPEVPVLISCYIEKHGREKLVAAKGAG